MMNGYSKAFWFTATAMVAIIGAYVALSSKFQMSVDAAQDSKIFDNSTNINSMKRSIDALGKNTAIICATVAKGQCEPYRTE